MEILGEPVEGVSVTSESQILVELTPDDLVPEHPFDLAGKTLLFTPDDSGGYSRSVRALAWEEDIGSPVDDGAEIELRFPFGFSGEEWGSFFISRYGLITFGEPYAFPRNGPDRWGTMSAMATPLLSLTAISALYKPRLGGWSRGVADEAGNTQHVSRQPDRVVLTWITDDHTFYVHGRPHAEKTRFQIVLHADGRVAFHYAAAPENPDETILDGIVGLFPAVTKAGEISRIPDATEPAVPAHLDLVETAIHRTSHPGFVMVEFTTRGPIRPEPDLEFHYFLFLDTDRPWWTERDRDDQDSLWSVTVRPDGSTSAEGPGAGTSHLSGNRVSFLVGLRDFGATEASVIAATWVRNEATQSWDFRADREDAPELVGFPAASDLTVDLSRPASQGLAAQSEVFHHVNPKEHLVPLVCRIITVLGDEFDLLVFHSQFRNDKQETGSNWGWSPGNVPIKGIGQESLHDVKSPCGSRIRGRWTFPVWVKSRLLANLDGSGGYTPSAEGLTHFGHEFAHTWVTRVSYMKNGEREPLWTVGDGSHWVRGLHTPALFPWEGTENGSIMGGYFWRENPDGTFRPTNGWSNWGGGLSWLDLYLAGLATPDEVPDTFLLRNLQETGAGRRGPHTGEKEVISIEQIIAAEGPRDPPAAQSQKAFNAGFVYLTLPDEAPDQELLRLHASFVERAVEHWSHVTGGRGQLTTRLDPPAGRLGSPH